MGKLSNKELLDKFEVTSFNYISITREALRRLQSKEMTPREYLEFMKVAEEIVSSLSELTPQ